MSKTLGGEFYGSRQFCFSFRRRTLLNDRSLRSEKLAYLTVLLSVSAEKNTRLRVRGNLTVLFFISTENFTDRQLRGECTHPTRQNIDKKDFREKNNDRNECLALTKTICQLGFRCGQQSSQPAATAVGFDRKTARSRQLFIPSTLGVN